jgi:hypothetical protein
MLKHCAANTKRRLSALPNVGPYIYDVKISGFTRSSMYMTLVGQELIEVYSVHIVGAELNMYSYLMFGVVSTR